MDGADDVAIRAGEAGVGQDEVVAVQVANGRVIESADDDDIPPIAALRLVFAPFYARQLGSRGRLDAISQLTPEGQGLGTRARDDRRRRPPGLDQ